MKFANLYLRFATVILMVFVSLFFEANAQQNFNNNLRSIPILNRIESSDYNGGIQCWSFDQDSSGIIYVANNEGLLEFDGNTWTKYSIPSCTKLRAVKVDANNRIYVGGQGQIGYFEMTKHGLKFTSLLNLLPKNYKTIAETWKILEFNEKIYFITESQMLEYTGKSINILRLPGYMMMAFVVNSKLYAQFYNSGLFEYSENKFKPLKGCSNLPQVIEIIPQVNSNIFFCLNGDVFIHTKAGVTKKNLDVELNEVNVVTKLNNGDLAVGTQNHGLIILNSDLSLKQHYTKNEGLSDRTIKALFEDDFNNLWVALNNGIDYLYLSLPFTLINDEVGLEGTGYAACKFNDELFLGTNNGLFRQFHSEGNYNKRFELVKGSRGQVYNFSQIYNQLILNHASGAFQIIGDSLRRIHNLGSWKFMETKLSNVAIGGDYQGIAFFKYDGKTFKNIGRLPELEESSRVMEYESDSVLWMSHGSKGAYKISFDDNLNLKNNIKLYGKNNGFPSNILIDVYSLNGKLVFGAEQGIYDYDRESDSFKPNTFFNKWLGVSRISEMASDGQSIYYIQNGKFGRLKQEEFGSYNVETNLFNHINTFLNDDLANITIIDKSNVLIGAKEGFIKYNPQREFNIVKNFEVLLRSVEIQDSASNFISYNPSFISNMPVALNRAIKFYYSSPYFDGFKDLKYSYKLEPLDENWSDWSPQGEKEYPYMPYGNYTFKVKALNVYGLESFVTTFSFEVLKPWYVKEWALGSYLVIGLILIFSIPLLQQKKFSKEKDIINESKFQELEMKDKEINQISEESRREINRIANEKLRSEINHKNDQLTTITMQFMTKNEFMQSVRDKIYNILNSNSDKSELRKIIKTIDNNLSDKNAWDQFAYHFDQVHGDYLKNLASNNIRLSPREIKLAAFLRMNMSSKEISRLLNITVRSVELARHRLRKKLNLNRDQNLVEYLIELDNKPEKD